MLRQIRKTTKNHPLDVAKKYVETYSSSNAAARGPEERVQLINIQYIHYKINSLTQNLQKKKKIERTRRLTDLEWPESPAQSLHTPSTSHNNPRTSQPCRQNNNFRLIYSNVRNYSFPISCFSYYKLLIRNNISRNCKIRLKFWELITYCRELNRVFLRMNEKKHCIYFW